jgi:hypothetical protein
MVIRATSPQQTSNLVCHGIQLCSSHQCTARPCHHWETVKEQLSVLESPSSPRHSRCVALEGFLTGASKALEEFIVTKIGVSVFLHQQDIGWSRSCVPVLRWSCKLWGITKHNIVYPGLDPCYEVITLRPTFLYWRRRTVLQWGELSSRSSLRRREKCSCFHLPEA